MGVRVLMIGWEFPPRMVGGLGIACKGFAEALAARGAHVTFMLPAKQEVDSPLPFLFAGVPESTYGVYGTGAYGTGATPHTTEHHTITAHNGAQSYGYGLIERVRGYTLYVKELLSGKTFDVIHAHDWLTYPAALRAKEVTGLPLVVHVHNTIFDRGLGMASDEERAIEYGGIAGADVVVAISHYVKRTLVEKYGIDPYKIVVVHNGTLPATTETLPKLFGELRRRGKKMVLYHGRITIQKGVEYFVRAARRVRDVEPNAVFIISGTGDMREQIIEEVVHLGLADDVLFVDGVWGAERDQMYQSVDVLVVPSVSEPFGLIPVEGALQGTPVILSNTAGSKEVLTHSLGIDFWDVDALAHKIIAVLRYPPLGREMSENARVQAQGITWEKAAGKCLDIYTQLVPTQSH